MFFDDRKKMLMTLMSKRDKKGAPIYGPVPMQPSVAMSEGGEVDGRHSASQDALAAIHEKDAMRFMESMINFLDIHHAAYDSKNEPGEGKE